MLAHNLLRFQLVSRLWKTDPVTLHINSVAKSYPSLKAVKTFNDLLSWWDPLTPTASVIVPQTGTSIKVANGSLPNNFLRRIIDFAFHLFTLL